MENLPREIIYDVLSRLPVKSLLRFRCVCKSWLSLISDDPLFVKMHLHRVITDSDVAFRSVLLPTYSYFKSIDFEALINPPPPSLSSSSPLSSSSSSSMVLNFVTRPSDRDRHIGVSVSGSCNGLVFLVVDHHRMIVGNPCTRKFRELPKPNLPLVGYIAHGFGYDSSVDDYKVVRAVQHDTTRMELFSLKSSYWKRVKGIHSSIRFESGNWVFLDGSLHCIASCREYHGWIFYFKLATEEFCELVPLPPNQGARNFLFVLGGCLLVVCRDSVYNYQIWMMKEYGVEASWTKLLTFPRRDCMYVEPLWMSKNGELLLDVGDKNLMMYDLKKMTSRDLDVPGPRKFSTSTYIETLVSPNGNQA